MAAHHGGRGEEGDAVAITVEVGDFSLHRHKGAQALLGPFGPLPHFVGGGATEGIDSQRRLQQLATVELILRQEAGGLTEGD